MANDHSLELKVSLRVNDSLGDVRKQLIQIENKLRNIKLKADLDISNSQINIDKCIDKLQNSVKKLKLTADLDYGKSRDNLNQAINKLNSNAKINVEVNAKVNDKSLNQTVDKVKQATKSLSDDTKLDFDISQFQKKMQLAVQTLQQSKSHKLNNNDIDSFLQSVNKLSASTPNARQEMQKLNLQLKEIVVNAKQVDSSMATALRGILNWTVASTAFFAPIKALKDITQRTIELDTAMTELRRVMNLPDYKFTEMLQSSIDATDELSGKVKDFLSIVSEFGRMGYNDKQAVELSKTAQVLTNISDLSADDAVKSLVASMNSFNVTAEQSISIAD